MAEFDSPCQVVAFIHALGENDNGPELLSPPQGLGKAFRPGELAGYFNDLTCKTLWNGQIDVEGVPVNILDDGRRVYFATTIAQKALAIGINGCWIVMRKIKARFLASVAGF